MHFKMQFIIHISENIYSKKPRKPNFYDNDTLTSNKFGVSTNLFSTLLNNCEAIVTMETLLLKPLRYSYILM